MQLTGSPMGEHTLVSLQRVRSTAAQVQMENTKKAKETLTGGGGGNVMKEVALELGLEGQVKSSLTQT